MIKIKFKYLFFFCVFSLLSGNIFYLRSTANSLPVENSSLGGIVPKKDTLCSMTNASVIMDIDATNVMNNFSFSFKGNYTIFNPCEEINLTIAAPFSRMDISPDSICDIKLNGSKIPYNIIDFDDDDSVLWEEFLENHFIFYDSILLICNITIPGNTSVNLEYEFDTDIPTYLNNLYEFWIHYLVGTARAWEGKITESVEFRVHGKTPDKFYNYSCTVSELLNGTSYLWEWENEIIYDDVVYIIYLGNYTSSRVIILPEILIQQIIISSIIIIGILGLAYFFIRRVSYILKDRDIV